MPAGVTLLAVDCALDACQIAVARGDQVVLLSEPMRKGHAERVAPMAHDAMTQAGIGFDALDRVVVTVGPGSFAGVRVGLSFARGLAVALGKPCVGFSTLDVFARAQGDAGLRAGVVAAPDGVFVGVWNDGAVAVAPARLPVEAARAVIPNEATIFGPAADRFGAPACENWAPLATLVRLGRDADPATHPADPLYLRPPYATLPEA